MSDLISRSALLEEMYQKMSLMGASRDGQHPISMETVIDFIKDYPVAYDVEQVVKELEDYSMWKKLMIYDLTYREREIIARAIEIVKGGGVR